MYNSFTESVCIGLDIGFLAPPSQWRCRGILCTKRPARGESGKFLFGCKLGDLMTKEYAPEQSTAEVQTVRASIQKQLRIAAMISARNGTYLNARSRSNLGQSACLIHCPERWR
jgi:hypothetical protein